MVAPLYIQNTTPVFGVTVHQNVDVVGKRQRQEQGNQGPLGSLQGGHRYFAKVVKDKFKRWLPAHGKWLQGILNSATAAISVKIV